MKIYPLILILVCGCAGTPKSDATRVAAPPKAATPLMAVSIWAAEHPQLTGELWTERLNLREEGYDILLKTGDEHYLIRVETKGDVWEVVSSAPCDADFLIPSL